MSTKGSLIIRKNNTDKELFIPADANPEISGRDAVRMAKSLDLNATFISILLDCLSATTNVKCGSAINKFSQRDANKKTGNSLAVVIEYTMKRLLVDRPAKRIASLIASLTGKIFVKS